MSNTLSFSVKEKTLMSYTNGNAGNVIRNRTINGNFLIMLSKNFGIVLPLSSLIVKKYFGFNVLLIIHFLNDHVRFGVITFEHT